jgi:2'-5' RNA ligase
MARLFFALWAPPAAAAALYRWALAVRGGAGGRAVEPAAIHLTLAFLGEVSPARMKAASAGARRVQGRAHALPIETCMQWTRRGIVWAGPKQTPLPLAALAGALAEELARDAFRLEARAFLAHVTLLRNARRPCTLPPLPAIEWPVEAFVLARSTLAAGGSRYDIIERFALEPPPPGAH